MQDGICPKCSAASVYAVTAHDTARRLAIRPFTEVALTHLICAACGYVEPYVSSEADRQKVAQKGQHIPPRPA